MKCGRIEEIIEVFGSGALPDCSIQNGLFVAATIPALRRAHSVANVEDVVTQPCAIGGKRSCVMLYVECHKMELTLETIAYCGLETDIELRRFRPGFSRQLAGRCASREGFAQKSLNKTYNEFVLDGRNSKEREYIESGIWDGTMADYDSLLCNVGLVRWYDLRGCAQQWSGTARAIEFDLPLHHLDDPTHRRRGRFLETAGRWDPKPATGAIPKLYGVVPHLSSNWALSAGSLWWRGERAGVVLSRVR
ncbi:hypothetical protein AtubIFM56815_010341 [Aspergillus tubingensis]|uniref:Uncharacterized protein n=1 Tax=Aspergillus tubingensis TaxID=5068 RepID=A0A9W6ASC3_ASPTU|nr:hypothetical protein AtubIFM56815_010341 [Aspergillus tubingensis]